MCHMCGTTGSITLFVAQLILNHYFSILQRIMESISVSGEVGGAGGSYSYNALKRLDKIWSSICSAQTGMSLFCAAKF